MNPDGSQPQPRWTGKKKTYADPSFSPDGRRIAYMNGGQIYVMQIDGSNQRRVRGISRTEYHILYGWARG